MAALYHGAEIVTIKGPMQMPELYVGELAALATAVLWTLSTLVWTAAGKRIGALPVCFIRMMMVCVL